VGIARYKNATSPGRQVGAGKFLGKSEIPTFVFLCVSTRYQNQQQPTSMYNGSSSRVESVVMFEKK
jgi:hypothetical protein